VYCLTGLTHENLYSSKNNHYRKKSAALPAAALPFAAADRDWNRTARTFLPKSSLAIGLSGSAALPLPRVPPFLFYIMSLFCVYIFHAESLVCTFAPRCLRNMPADKAPALRYRLRRRGAVPKAATGAERGRRA